MTDKIQVRIYAKAPLFVEADAEDFGLLFSNMADDDQCEVLAAMVKHMQPHQIQWDYIILKMEREYPDTLRWLRSIFAEDQQ